MIQFIFIILAVLIFIAIIGWPIWLIIWTFIQKKKTGKFPWKKLFIAVVVIIVGLFLIKTVSSQMLKNIGSGFGIESTEEMSLPKQERPSGGQSIKNLRLPDFE